MAKLDDHSCALILAVIVGAALWPRDEAEAATTDDDSTMGYSGGRCITLYVYQNGRFVPARFCENRNGQLVRVDEATQGIGRGR